MPYLYSTHISKPHCHCCTAAGQRGNGSSVDLSMLYVPISSPSMTRSDQAKIKPNPAEWPINLCHGLQQICFYL